MVKAKIIKPTIPILFLDTNFFIDLVRNRHQEDKSPFFEDEGELVELISKLTKKKKLLCPQGDQNEEYELGTKYEEELRDEQIKLSLGIRATHHYGVEMYQTQMAMEAFVEGASEVVCDHRCLFQRDPVKALEEQLSERFIVSAHIPMSETYLSKKRKTRRELAEEFEKMRLEKREMGVEYDDWVKHEQLGKLDAINITLKSSFPKLAQSLPLTQEEINGLQILGDLLAYLSHFLKRDATIEDVTRFLRSRYYATIPFVFVQSRLFASMWVQSGRIKESDNFDFYQTSQMLPFSTYFLTDSSHKHRITTKPLMLDKEYEVKVYSIREIKNLIRELEGL